MTQSKFEDWRHIEWTPFDSKDEGTYNKIYKSNDGKHIFKKVKSTLAPRDQELDKPDRAVRLWNEINPDLPAFQAITKYGEGWICPFVAGVSPTDEEISNTIIDIFNRTKRILVDAPSHDNFKKTPQGKVVCIDIGMAFLLEKEETNLVKLKRNKSQISLYGWERTGPNFANYFIRASYVKPHTVKTIKALLFIQQNRPDIFDVTFLKGSPALISTIAKGYDDQNVTIQQTALTALANAKPIQSPSQMSSSQPIVSTASTKVAVSGTSKALHNAQQLLAEVKPIDLAHIKESCIHVLNRYITSRGALDDQNRFNPSFITMIFRNKELTASKVGIARRLINNLKVSNTLREMELAIEDAGILPDAKKSSFTSGLEMSLGKCLLIVEMANKHINQTHITQANVT